MNLRLEDVGRLILRVGVGSLLLMHGWAKVRTGIGFVQTQVAESGLPAFVAYGVYVGEVVAPILVMIGLLTRPAALVMAFDVMMAILLARQSDIARRGPGGAPAIELELLFVIGALAIACLGAGRIAVGKAGRLN